MMVAWGCAPLHPYAFGAGEILSVFILFIAGRSWRSIRSSFVSISHFPSTFLQPVEGALACR